MELSNLHQPESSEAECNESGVACHTESVAVTSVACEAMVEMIDASCQTECRMVKDECCQTDRPMDTSDSRTSLCKNLEKMPRC